MQDEKENPLKSVKIRRKNSGMISSRERAQELRKLALHRGRNKKTILKEEAFKAIQQKLIERSMGLIDTQTVIAHGSIKIYKITTHFEGAGKNKKRVRSKPKLVKNENEIAAVIGYEYGDEESPNNDTEYFFVTTQDPDNRAIKDQLDRVFGPATQKIDITSDGFSLKELYNTEKDGN